MKLYIIFIFLLCGVHVLLAENAQIIDSSEIHDREHDYEAKKNVNSDAAKVVIDESIEYAMKSVLVPPPLRAIVTVGKVVYSTGKTLKETGDLSRAFHAGKDSGIRSVKEIVESIPGARLARLGTNIAVDLYEGRDLKSIIEQRGEEAVENTDDSMVKLAFCIAKDLKNGESITDTISKNYANDNPDLKLALKLAKIGKDMENTLIGTINDIRNSETDTHMPKEGNIHDVDNLQNNIRNGATKLVGDAVHDIESETQSTENSSERHEIPRTMAETSDDLPFESKKKTI